MTEYLIQDTTLSAIAEAIRNKTGKADNITPEQMPTEIMGITTGGDEGEKPFDCHSVTFVYNDKSYVRSVADGDTCADPVERGLIPTPTKESTAQYDYTYYGWGASDGGAANANILKNITEDKTVYAIFTATVRYYTITWLDDDGVTELPGQKQWAYGSVPSYAPTKDGYMFVGWNKELATVTGDAAYIAVWEVATVVDEEISDSWDDIIAAANNGTYKEKYKLGNWKKLTFTQPYSTVQCTLTMQIVAFDSDLLADGNGYAPITWVAKEVYNYYEDRVDYGYDGWSHCALRNALNDDIANAIVETNVVSAVKEVVKRQTEYVNKSLSTQTSIDKFWIPSKSELTASSSTNYCDVYPDAASRKKKRSNGVGQAWWLRDTYSYTSSSSFKYHIVKYDGTFSNDNGKASGAGDWVLGFCI